MEVAMSDNLKIHPIEKENISPYTGEAMPPSKKVDLSPDDKKWLKFIIESFLTRENQEEDDDKQE
jgi:hypothetical protein